MARHRFGIFKRGAEAPAIAAAPVGQSAPGPPPNDDEADFSPPASAASALPGPALEPEDWTLDAPGDPAGAAVREPEPSAEPEEAPAEAVIAGLEAGLHPAEQRATAEIVALERDLENAKREAEETRRALEQRLEAAEKRALSAAARLRVAEQRLAELEAEAGDERARRLSEIEHPPAASGDRGGEAPGEKRTSLSRAGFAELRELGMSVTQAKRVIGHREVHGGFTSVDELEDVPGFPRIFLAEVKGRLAP